MLLKLNQKRNKKIMLEIRTQDINNLEELTTLLNVSIDETKDDV